MEEASEMYHRAANMFKMAKNWSKAGDAFCEVANLSLKNQNRHDAATNFVDAANCYKKISPTGMQLPYTDLPHASSYSSKRDWNKWNLKHLCSPQLVVS